MMPLRTPPAGPQHASLAEAGVAPPLRMLLIAIGIFAVLLAGSVMGWWYTRTNLQRQSALRFQHATAYVMEEIEGHLELYLTAVRGARGLYAASKAVERDEFSAFFQGPWFQGRYPGFWAVAFVERVRAPEQAAFLQRVRSDTSLQPSGYPDFALTPAGERAESFVVTYLEPFAERTRALFGFDMGADPVGLRVLEEARDSGRTTLTGRLPLRTAQDHGAGFRVVEPVYRNGLPHGTVDERRAALQGFVVGMVEAAPFFKDIMAHSLRTGGFVDVEVFDGALLTFEIWNGAVRVPEELILYDADPARVEMAAEHRAGLHALLPLEAAGRTWSVHVVAQPASTLGGIQQRLPMMVLGAGILVSSLILITLLALTASRYRAVRLAQRMTSAIRKQQERLLIQERAIAATADGIVITDPTQPDNPIVYCNRGYERMTGYSKAEVLGKNGRFLRGQDQDQEGVRTIREAVRNRQGCRVLLRNYRKDGAMFWNDLSMTPVLDEQGDVINFVGVLHDVTERKRLEDTITRKAAEAMHANEELLRRERTTQSLLEDLQVSKRRLEQQQHSLEEAHANLQRSHEEMLAMQLQLIQSEKLESIGRLAAGVAHEVKNPLAVILMGVAYLNRQMANGDPNVPMVLGEMDLAVRRADTVIRGLLDFSAPSELNLNAEDLNAVIDRTLVLVKHELDTAHVTVVKALSSLPPINLDGNKIQQVFLNLFMNAVHAMPSGGTLTVRTCVKPTAAIQAQLGIKGTARFARSDTLVVAEVEDTGTGIPEAKLQKVFDPFFTTKPTGKGTGLGLTVTKKIVELHEGLIHVRNRPEGGVRVTVVFA